MSPLRALAQTVAFAAAPILFALLAGLAMVALGQLRGPAREMMDLTMIVPQLERLETDAATPEQRLHREDLETLVVGRYGARVRDGSLWRSPLAAAFKVEERAFIERLVAGRAPPSPEEVERAAASFHGVELPGVLDSLQGFAGVLQILLLLEALVGLLTAPLLRGGLSLRLCSMVLVTRDGQLASRLRCLGRAALAVVPLALPFLPWFHNRNLANFGALVVVLLLALATLRTPARTLHDRIAGTWRVPL